MADSQGVWLARTVGIALVAALLTALLTTLIQQLIWGTSNVGVSGGAAAGVSTAVFMARRKRPAETPPKP